MAEAAEASNLALATNGDVLEVMMRTIRNTAMEAIDSERTPRQRLTIWRRRFTARLDLKDVAYGNEVCQELR